MLGKTYDQIHVGDTITARVEVMEKIDSKKVRLKTICLNQDAVIVLEGDAMVSPPRRSSKD